MAPLSPPVRNRLVVGCGYLGRAYAARALATGNAVFALTRTNSDALKQLGVRPVTGDVLDAASLGGLRGLPLLHSVVYAVGYDRTQSAGFHELTVRGLTNVLGVLPEAEHVIYVSSTSVYHQTGGVWVDGDSETRPAEANGRAILEAESRLRSQRPGAKVLRLAGIYGPGRWLREQPLRRGEAYISDPDIWLNLIHQTDAVEALFRAEDDCPPGGTVTVADGSPVTRRAFYTELAVALGAPEARFHEVTPSADEPNRRVRRFGDWLLAYPDYRAALATLSSV